jgi:hypothetical protein
MATVHDLKLDVTSLNLEGEQKSLLCLNFNIPLRTQENYQEFDQVLRNITSFLTEHFLPPLRISFQVTASYFLINSVTGDERLWTGSFFPANRVSLSGPFFQNFHPVSFPRKLHEYTAPENFLQCFSFEELDTEWKFSQVASFIVNCQLTVRDDHQFIREFDMWSARRRHRRRHVILAYPW